ncbi:MAG TPA: heparan-alpha-glucosaminide N-acetyltransferase domain-containing protein [Polyangia bacterium]|nr:heparan-alpha-glucosaminide N-acetyltransferase domain-containing protein [Polyangia bacterium]
MTATTATPEVTDAARARAASRLPALDWMRGLVMVLMAIDHSSDAFNGGRFFTDAARMWQPGSALPAAQFVTRWITHICAPTFLFLAGTSLAFTVSRQVAAGDRPRDIDRYILVRGFVIAAFELWISLTVMGHGHFIFQVLYGIGSAYMLMALLRRLPDRGALALGLGLVATSELLVGLGLRAGLESFLPVQLLLTGGQRGRLIIAYPTISWLAILLLGWCWGRRLVTRPTARQTAARDLLRAGVAALLLFAALRAANQYGNMRLVRDSWAPLQWLHVSKYPPSVTYDALELGLMALILAGMFRLAARRTPSPNSLFMVLGQVPMFFYLLHFPILVQSARLLGVEKRFGVASAYLGAAAVIALLYPLCRWYRGYKAAHRTSWVRYV